MNLEIPKSDICDVQPYVYNKSRSRPNNKVCDFQTDNPIWNEYFDNFILTSLLTEPKTLSVVRNSIYENHHRFLLSLEYILYNQGVIATN